MRYNFKDPPHVFSMFISCHLSIWFKSSRHDGSLITRQGRPQNTTIGLLSPRCHQAASGAAEIPMAEFDRLNLQTQEECRTSISKVFRRHFCQAQQWTSPHGIAASFVFGIYFGSAAETTKFRIGFWTDGDFMIFCIVFLLPQCSSQNPVHKAEQTWANTVEIQSRGNTPRNRKPSVAALQLQAGETMIHSFFRFFPLTALALHIQQRHQSSSIVRGLSTAPDLPAKSSAQCKPHKALVQNRCGARNLGLKLFHSFHPTERELNGLQKKKL